MRSGGSSGRLAPVARRRMRDRRPPFALIATITVTGIMGNALIAPAGPDVVRDFGISKGAVGLLLAATTAPGIVMAPVIGLLADRYGRREVLVPCLALFGVAGGAAAFAQTYPQLLALRLLQGVGSAALVNLAVVLIADHWDGPERARVIGRNSAVLTASIAVLPPLGGILADAGGWRLTFAPYWVAVVVAALGWVMLPRGVRYDTSFADQLRETGPYLRSAVVIGAFVLGFWFFFLIFGEFLTVLPLHLEGAFGVGSTGRGFVLALPAVPSTISALNVGRLRGRFGASALIGAGFGFLVIGFAAIAAAGSLPVLAAGALVYGFGEGLVIPTLQDTVAGSAPTRARGSVVAVFVGVARAGQTAGPVGAGALSDAIGTQGALAGGAGLAAALAIGQRLVLRGRSGRRRRRTLAGTDAPPLG